MTKKADLRELSRAPDFLGNLDAESDRGLALIVSAYVEHSLRRAITVRLPNHHAATDLFEKFGPLSSFSAKIQLGLALGVFGPRSRADMDRIRDIRNSFAHSAQLVTFETPAVAAIVHDLDGIDRHSAGGEFLREVMAQYGAQQARNLFYHHGIWYAKALDIMTAAWPAPVDDHFARLMELS